MRFLLPAACLVSAILCADGAGAEEAGRLLSPNGRVEVRFRVEGEQAIYEVLREGRSVIAPSPLGLDVSGGSLVQFRVLGETRNSAEHRYRLVAGKTSEVREAYNEATFSLQESGATARRLDIVFRAYDDGAAFRYVLPAQSGVSEINISGEQTRFAFPVDYQCWGANVGRFGTSHESEFDPVRASLIRPHNLFDLPLVCAAPGVAFAIAEANLDNYAGLYLSGRGEGGLGVSARLSPRLDDPSLAVRLAMDEDGMVSPWRVVMLGETPGALIESNLIGNLNPAPDFDASWVRPGRSAWDWWSGSQAAVANPGMNTETMRAYVDFAADNGFEYVLIDDGWYVGANGWIAEPHADITRPVPELDLSAVIAHARARGVGVWLWMHWRLIDARMDEAMDTYRRWGIAGIKVDYMDRDDQEIVEFYHRLLRRAAAHRLMVDLHGAYPPRGLARTYPHFLTQEGVLGAEYNKWSQRVTARHNVTLAYTRMLLGPMDYTPGAMRNATPETFESRWLRPEVMTTRAHGLAMYVVYESPFVSVADSPDSYDGQAGLDFLRAVPPSWDETRFIAGEVGEFVAVARRRGRDWYIGVMNNETAREVRLPLDFLGRGHRRAEIWADGAAPTAIVKTEARVDAATPLVLHLAANGGAAIRLRR
jgi:alpha-glucosidase